MSVSAIDELISNATAVHISQEEYEKHVEDSDGYCLSCGEWTSGGVEPDAEGYKCESCGESAVVGAEQLAIYEILDFS